MRPGNADMTSIRFVNARLVDPAAGTVSEGSLSVEGGRIAAVGQAAEVAGAAGTVDCGRHILAPGIVDIGAKIGEPGERHKESFRTAGLAAAAGGVTTIVTRPDTVPAIDNPETLEFFTRRAHAATPVRVKPMATLTRAREGRRITEIGLLRDGGAAAFSDCDAFVEDARVMLRCLAYCKQHGALVVGHPQEPSLSRGASATSGKFASLKGIPSVPAMAERIGLERDVALAELSRASYHADQVSTRQGLEVLEAAKSKGLDVSAGVSIHHLTLNEFDIADYRTFFKIKPPLRSEDDRKAAVAAVASGLISVISSMHTPQDEESKRLPFAEAASGAVALETMLPAALRIHHSGEVDLPTLFRALSLNPSRRLGLDSGRLEPGAPADLVLFDPDVPYVLDRFTLLSKCKNTPFDGQRVQGRVLMTIVGGREVFRSKAWSYPNS